MFNNHDANECRDTSGRAPAAQQGRAVDFFGIATSTGRWRCWRRRGRQRRASELAAALVPGAYDRPIEYKVVNGFYICPARKDYPIKYYLTGSSTT
ncbi:hypothetical protein ACH4UY_37920 [Streptomyces longwoodensis]|uniref:hypothetical protein n=1 Tax=Streptomyces longwoodensis TaxID=68231 RepID=UPI0037B7DEBB